MKSDTNPMLSLMESCDAAAKKRIQDQGVRSMVTLEEAASPFDPQRDLKATRSLFAKLCEMVIDNSRIFGQINRKPSSLKEQHCRSIDAPPKACEFMESVGGGLSATIRVFGLSKNESCEGTYVTAEVYKDERRNTKLIPFGTGNWNETVSKYTFDDGHDQKIYEAKSEEDARVLWETEVPALLRSDSVAVYTESHELKAKDFDGPFLVETSKGTRSFDLLSEALAYVSNKDFCESYRILDGDNEVFAASATIEQAPIAESLTATSVSDALARGITMLRITPAPGSSIDPLGVMAETTSAVRPGEVISFSDNTGKIVIGRVIDAAKSFAVCEGWYENEAHIDNIRESRDLYVKINGKSKPIIHDRITVSEGHSSFANATGTVVAPLLNEDGSPKAISNTSKYNAMTESFVRLDSGELVVITNEQLIKA